MAVDPTDNGPPQYNSRGAPELVVPVFIYENTTFRRYSNSPAAETFWQGVNAYQIWVDAAGFEQVKCTYKMETSGLIGSSKLRFLFSPSQVVLFTIAEYMDPSINDPLEIALDAPSSVMTPWKNLRPELRVNNLQIAMCTRGGNSVADPQFFPTFLIFR